MPIATNNNGYNVLPLFTKPAYRGTTLPIISKQTVKSDPQRGTTILTEILGISFDTMVQMYNQFYANGVAVSFETENGRMKITADDATQNNPIDTWELEGDSPRLDLFSNPVWGVLSGLISENQMGQILAYLNSNTPAHNPAATPPNGAFDAPASSNDVDLSPLSGGIVERAYVRYQLGNTEFEWDNVGAGYVLKHTCNIPNRWTGIAGGAADALNEYIGYIYTTGEMLSEITNGQIWTTPVNGNSYLYFKINYLGSISTPITFGNYVWGWKKGRQDMGYAANNRLNITQKYVYGWWNSDDYLQR
jgi:hypothetical protein